MADGINAPIPYGGTDHPPLVNDPFIQLNGKQKPFYRLVFMTFSNPL